MENNAAARNHRKYYYAQFMFVCSAIIYETGEITENIMIFQRNVYQARDHCRVSCGVVGHANALITFGNFLNNLRFVFCVAFQDQGPAACYIRRGGGPSALYCIHFK